MVSDLLWIAAAVLIIIGMVYLDRKKRRNKTGVHPGEYTEEQKEVERQVEKEKSRRNGPPTSGGTGGGM
ncbi:hypothetical protein [Salibacterium sp. K-3]